MDSITPYDEAAAVDFSMTYLKDSSPKNMKSAAKKRRRRSRAGPAYIRTMLDERWPAISESS